MFKGISPRKVVKKIKDGKTEEVHRLSLGIKERYYCDILMMTCRLNKYSYDEINKEQHEKVAYKLSNSKVEKLENEYILFDDAIKEVGEEELYCALEWFKSQLDFAFDILDKCENNSIGRKKKVASILDEL